MHGVFDRKRIDAQIGVVDIDTNGFVKSPDLFVHRLVKARNGQTDIQSRVFDQIDRV